VPTSSSADIVPPGPAGRDADPRFAEAEAFTLKFESHTKDVLEKTHKKLMKKYSELSSDYSELGAVYNAFSLNETMQLANGIEKMGQAVDTMHLATNILTQKMEEQFSEPLHEYSQFSDVIKSVLKYRTQQQQAYQTTCDNLETKRAYFTQLEKVEMEAQRLEEALKKEGYNSPKISKASVANRGSRGFVGTISDKINSIIDADPETTRKHNIAKTKDIIAQLEETKAKLEVDLESISISIQEDLDRFQRQKIRDFRRMLIQYAQIQSEYCKRNLAAWSECKAEVDKIEI